MSNLRGAIGQVCAGRNGRLFLGRQDGFDLGVFARREALAPNLMLRWRRTLERRGEEFAKRGMPYIFMIVPDAPSVYPEDLPAPYGDHFEAPGAAFLREIGPIPGVTFVYPLEALREARGGLDVYHKNDSHWTTYGSYVGYRVLMSTMGKLVADSSTIPARDLKFSFRNSYGDLGALMDPEQSREFPVPDIAGDPPMRGASWNGVARQTAVETQWPKGTARALFFRDSFMTDLAPYIARSFGTVLTLGTTTRVLFDAVDEWRPDIVVSEVAERRLVNYENDHELESFQTIYQGNYQSEAGKVLLGAMLIADRDPAGAARMIAESEPELMESHVHAFCCALIREKNGDPQGARHPLRAALAASPVNASYLALAARLSLASGNLDEAWGHAEAAVFHAPYNGYYQELHAYCLFQAGLLDQAEAAAERALQVIRDHPNLWYWAAVIQLAKANPAGAVERAQQAALLNPSHAAYRGLIEQFGGGQIH